MNIVVKNKRYQNGECNEYDYRIDAVNKKER